MRASQEWVFGVACVFRVRWELHMCLFTSVCVCVCAGIVCVSLSPALWPVEFGSPALNPVASSFLYSSIHKLVRSPAYTPACAACVYFSHSSFLSCVWLGLCACWLAVSFVLVWFVSAVHMCSDFVFVSWFIHCTTCVSNAKWMCSPVCPGDRRVRGRLRPSVHLTVQVSSCGLRSPTVWRAFTLP